MRVYQAGGPTARGSLRILRHFRGKQLMQQTDVYDLLLHGIRSGVEGSAAGRHDSGAAAGSGGYGRRHGATAGNL